MSSLRNAVQKLNVDNVVLDTSALVDHLKGEPGGEIVFSLLKPKSFCYVNCQYSFWGYFKSLRLKV